MSIEVNDENSRRIDITCNIVISYISNNHVVISDLPRLIEIVHAAIDSRSANDLTQEHSREMPSLAQIRKSVTRDALISLIDGKPYKTLKRHLANYGLTPDAYRTQFGLPEDYPMTAPAYSEKRSALAKSAGLGTKHRSR